MKQAGALLLAVLLLGGCNRAHYWQAPDHSDTATVIFTSHYIAAQPLICSSGRGFVPTRRALEASPIDPELFADNAAGEEPGEVRVSVPAGSPITLGVRFEPRNPEAGPEACTARAHFQPAPGQRYQAQFVMPGTQCGLSVTDADHQAAAEANPDQPACP